MPRPPNPIPTYRKHSSGQAFVLVAGRKVYLGKHGSKESRERYQRVLADVAIARSPERRDALRFTGGPTVSELILAWLEQARRTYANSRELEHYRPLLGRLNDLYGTTKAEAFTARDLRRLRDCLVAEGRTRKAINRDIIRIRTVFRWAGTEGLIGSGVATGLSLLRGLREGEEGVRESEPVKPVPDATVELTLPFLPPSLADFVRLLRLTGARPGELAAMRPVDLDTSGEIWWLNLERHKGSWRGKNRSVGFGPRAKAIVSKYIEGRPVDACCFRPCDTQEERWQAKQAARRTPAGQGNFRGSRRTSDPQRKPGDRWQTRALGAALAAAIRAANAAADAAGTPRVDPWRLYQLRHASATDLRKTFGLETAAVALGHSSARITDAVYAARDREKVEAALSKVG